MSRISQDFINNVGYLYEEINIQQNDFLNEESEYYDAEATELVEDILSTISAMMVYEGYSAEGIIGFLADSSEEIIIEKYLSFDENILIESVISEDYIVEQLEIFDFAINEVNLGSLIGKVAKGAASLAGRVASKPARMAVAKKVMQSANPTRTAAAVERLSARKVAKAGLDPAMVKNAPDLATKVRMGVTAPIKGVVTKAVQKVKDIAKGAKAALPKIAKGAGIFGLGAAGGYVGAKMGGAGSESKSTGSQRPPASEDAPSAPSTPSSRTPSTPGSRTPSTPGSRTPSTPGSRTPSKPTSKGAARPGETPMQQWARLHPNLAAKVKPGQSGYEEISQTRVKPGPYEKKDQTPTQGSSTAQVDKGDVEASIKQEQERQKKRLEQQKNTSMTTKESYEPYDIILNYLMSEGHADTLDEANYIMLEMDEKAIGTIIEEYEDYLLAEEVSEWVDGLLEEGYDLSEYTWDDIVEYYVSEANRGEEHEGLSPLKKIRRRNKEYFRNNPETVQKTTQRRGEHSSTRGIKKQKGEKSAFDTMRHVGGPYR